VCWKNISSMFNGTSYTSLTKWGQSRPAYLTQLSTVHIAEFPILVNGNLPQVLLHQLSSLLDMAYDDEKEFILLSLSQIHQLLSSSTHPFLMLHFPKQDLVCQCFASFQNFSSVVWTALLKHNECWSVIRGRFAT
jgi:hypothetical protein